MRLLALLAAGLFAGPLFVGCGPQLGNKTDNKPDDKKTADEELILGTWKAESLDVGDLKGAPTAEEVKKITYTFKKGGKLVVGLAGLGEGESKYTLDSSANPKTLDVINDKVTKLAVYQLDGDTLVVCMSSIPGGKGRPTELKADGRGVGVMTLKRVKDK